MTDAQYELKPDRNELSKLLVPCENTSVVIGKAQVKNPAVNKTNDRAMIPTTDTIALNTFIENLLI